MTSPVWASVSSHVCGSPGRRLTGAPLHPWGWAVLEPLGGDLIAPKRIWGLPQRSCSTDPVSLQEGFGWTSGVVLMLLDRYGDRLSSGTQTAFLEPPASRLPFYSASCHSDGPPCPVCLIKLLRESLPSPASSSSIPHPQPVLGVGSGEGPRSYGLGPCPSWNISKGDVLFCGDTVPYPMQPGLPNCLLFC